LTSGQVAVVTGSGKWIGKAIATRFAKEGYRVVINDLIDEEDLTAVKDEICSLVGDTERVSYTIGDVSEENVSRSLMDHAMTRFGKIDVLVNNASIAKRKAARKANEIPETAQHSYYEQVSPYFTVEEYEFSDASTRGAYLCIKEAVAQMSKYSPQGTQGQISSIINVASPFESLSALETQAYTYSMSGVDPFTTSRAGVKSLTKTIALQLAEKRIRVNAISPGIIESDSLKLKSIDEESKIPFHRMGCPGEVAEIALFLASEQASYITGTMIYADGGLSLTTSNYYLENKIEED
jgi:glucose 1-dehydrogenase